MPELLTASVIDDDDERERLAGAAVSDEPAAEMQMHLYLPLISKG